MCSIGTAHVKHQTSTTNKQLLGRWKALRWGWKNIKVCYCCRWCRLSVIWRVNSNNKARYPGTGRIKNIDNLIFYPSRVVFVDDKVSDWKSSVSRRALHVWFLKKEKRTTSIPWKRCLLICLAVHRDFFILLLISFPHALFFLMHHTARMFLNAPSSHSYLFEQVAFRIHTDQRKDMSVVYVNVSVCGTCKLLRRIVILSFLMLWFVQCHHLFCSWPQTQTQTQTTKRREGTTWRIDHGLVNGPDHWAVGCFGRRASLPVR